MTISGHSVRHSKAMKALRQNKLGLVWLGTVNDGKGAVKYSKFCEVANGGVTCWGKASQAKERHLNFVL